MLSWVSSITLPTMSILMAALELNFLQGTTCAGADSRSRLGRLGAHGQHDSHRDRLSLCYVPVGATLPWDQDREVQHGSPKTDPNPQGGTV